MESARGTAVADFEGWWGGSAGFAGGGARQEIGKWPVRREAGRNIFESRVNERRVRI
jgi:hypothetical protein